MSSCGIGGWGGPLPGDPGNDVVLSAVGVFGGIEVSWSFPTTNAYAVSYVKVFRGPNTTFASAVRIGESGGNSYLDKVTDNLNPYSYWIQLVSINGTELELVGPATATARDALANLLEELDGQLTSSHLSVALRAEIDSLPVLRNDLLSGISTLEAVDNTLSEAVSLIDSAVDSAVAAIANETGIRTGQVGELTNLIDAASLIAAAQLAEESDKRLEGIAVEARARIESANATAQAILRGLLAQEELSADASAGIALARRELKEDIVEGVSVEASERLLLAARLETADSDIVALVSDETDARVTAIGAEAAQRLLLAAQFRGTYEGNDPALITEGLFFQERQTRAQQYDALSQQITLMGASSGEQFDHTLIWYFDTGVDNWFGNSGVGTVTAVGGWLRQATTSGSFSNPYVASPDNLGINGAQYTQIKARIRKVGTPTWEGIAYFITTTDAVYGSTKSETMAEPAFDGGLAVVTWNMPALWTTATIRRIRLDLATEVTSTDYFELDWVAIGRPSPGASSAQILAVQTASVDRDDVLAEDILVLDGLINDPVTGLTATSLAVESLDVAINNSETGLVATSNKTLSLQSAITNGNAGSMLPSTFVDGLGYWTLDRHGSPTSVGAATGTLIDNDPDLGRCLEINYFNAIGENILTRGVIPARRGRIYKATATFKVVASDGSVGFGIVVPAQTAGYGDGGRNDGPVTTFTGTNTVETVSVLVSNTAGPGILAWPLVSAYLRFGLRLNTSETGLVIRLGSLVVEDVTELINTNANTLATVLLNYDTLVDADEAEAEARLELAGVVNDPLTGLVKTRSDLVSYQSAQADLDGATARDIRSLQSYGQKADEDVIRSILLGESAVAAVNSSIAIARQELSTNIVTGQIAEAQARLTLAGVVDSNVALLQQEQVVLANDIDAVAGDVLTLTTQVDHPTTGLPATRATLLNDYLTASNTEDAIAASATYLRAYSNLGSKTFRQTTAPVNRGLDPETGVAVPLVTGDMWVKTNEGNRAYQWSGSAWVDARDTAIAGVSASVTTIENSKIGYCTIGGSATDHTTRQTCEAASGTWNVGLPISQAVKQVQVNDGTSNATLESRFTAQKTVNNGLLAQSVLKLDVNGHTSGFGIYADSVGNSEFIANVGRFAVTSPDGAIPLWVANQTVLLNQVRRVAGSASKMFICKQAGTTGTTAPSIAGAIGTRVTSGSVVFQIASRVPLAVLSVPTTLNGESLGPGVKFDGGYIEEGTLYVQAAKVTGQLTAGQVNTQGMNILSPDGNTVVLNAGASLNSQVSASAIGAVQTTLANAPAGILNSTLTPSITAAAGTATWVGVTGSGRPEDNATVGATVGSNLIGLGDTSQIVNDTEFLTPGWTGSGWVAEQATVSGMPARVMSYSAGGTTGVGTSFVSSRFNHPTKAPVTPGEILRVEARVGAASGATGTIAFYVGHYDISGEYITATLFNVTNAATIATPTTIGGFYTVPANAYFVSFGMRRGSLTNNAAYGGRVEIGAPKFYRRPEWATITGIGRPEDNATVGAPAGTLVGGTPAETLVSNVDTALANANAAQTGLTNKLNKNAADILTAPITLQSSGAIQVFDGPRSMTIGSTGLAFVASGDVKMSFSTATGNLALKGDISGSTGNFVGSMSINARTWTAGNGIWLGMNGGYARAFIGSDAQHLKYDAQTGQLTLKLDAIVVTPNVTNINRTSLSTNVTFNESVSVSVSGGTAPYQYIWSVTPFFEVDGATVSLTSSNGNIAGVRLFIGQGGSNTSGRATCIVSDANGRTSSANIGLTASNVQ